MSADFIYGVPRPPKPKPSAQPMRPNEQRGLPAKGRVTSLQVGQGHGQIRLSDGRSAFFHRADLKDGEVFNNFQVGDAVAFELFEDRVSGARALQVRRQKR
jgi:hypothetical protein